MKKQILFAVLAMMPQVAMADANMPEDHAPIGVMGDHMHNKGEYMLSLRYAKGMMSGLRQGTDAVDLTAAGKMTAPKKMEMDMYMLGAMYAPTQNITLAMMLPYKSAKMDNVVLMNGRQFSTESSGIGDVKFTSLLRLYEGKKHKLHGGLGISLPTGSIKISDDMPAGNMPLGYGMQLGSGTHDFLPSLTYTAVDRNMKMTWGAQASGIIRMEDQNDRDYRLGNQFNLTTWAAYRFAPMASGSLRVSYTNQASAKGAALNTNPMMNAVFDPELQARRSWDLGLGVNLMPNKGALHGHRFAAELIVPMYQNLKGPSLERDYKLMFGWQKAF